MNYDWYQVTNLDDFIASGLISQEFELVFPTGLKTLLLTAGNLYSLTFDDVFLSIGMSEKNPFEFDGHAVFYDDDGLLWLGIAHED